MSTLEPPKFRLLAGSLWKKIVGSGALAVFGYSVWEVIALKSGDRVAAILLLVSFGVIFALSLSDAFRHRRETREWMKSRSSH
ncbi:MAG: hypothetical protein KF715_14975 [Candidatus Didemnitutus sp.]|nr:hypothetical protein [Candidatus Didemnitutus sp.]